MLGSGRTIHLHFREIVLIIPCNVHIKTQFKDMAQDIDHFFLYLPMLNFAMTLI